MGVYCHGWLQRVRHEKRRRSLDAALAREPVRVQYSGHGYGRKPRSIQYGRFCPHPAGLRSRPVRQELAATASMRNCAISKFRSVRPRPFREFLPDLMNSEIPPFTRREFGELAPFICASNYPTNALGKADQALAYKAWRFCEQMIEHRAASFGRDRRKACHLDASHPVPANREARWSWSTPPQRYHAVRNRRSPPRRHIGPAGRASYFSLDSSLSRRAAISRCIVRRSLAEKPAAMSLIQGACNSIAESKARCPFSVKTTSLARRW
jgi:hypothetical protein